MLINNQNINFNVNDTHIVTRILILSHKLLNRVGSGSEFCKRLFKQAVSKIIHYMMLYNSEQLHSSLGYRSPENYGTLGA
jgi:transposase InsO family protein